MTKTNADADYIPKFVKSAARAAKFAALGYDVSYIGSYLGWKVR